VVYFQEKSVKAVAHFQRGTDMCLRHTNKVWKK